MDFLEKYITPRHKERMRNENQEKITNFSFLGPAF
jgi:hypothetical protein